MGLCLHTQRCIVHTHTHTHTVRRKVVLSQVLTVLFSFLSQDLRPTLLTQHKPRPGFCLHIIAPRHRKHRLWRGEDFTRHTRIDRHTHTHTHTDAHTFMLHHTAAFYVLYTLSSSSSSSSSPGPSSPSLQQQTPTRCCGLFTQHDKALRR